MLAITFVSGVNYDGWFHMWQRKRVNVPYIDRVYLIFSSKDHPIRWRSTVIESFLIHVVWIKVREQEKAISNLLHKNIQYEFYAVIYDFYRFFGLCCSYLNLYGVHIRQDARSHTKNQSIFIRQYTDSSTHSRKSTHTHITDDKLEPILVFLLLTWLINKFKIQVRRITCSNIRLVRVCARDEKLSIWRCLLFLL